MNSREIEIELPRYLKPEDKAFFLEKSKFIVKDLRVRKVSNVFVSHEGLCLKNGLLVSNSSFNLKGKDDNIFYFQFYRLAMEQFLVARYGKSLKLRNLIEGNYLLIHTKWFNYFFWVTSSLSRLIRSKDYHHKVSLIYPQSWEKIAFVNDSLLMFPELRKIVIPDGEHLWVHHLLLPEVRTNSIGLIPKEAHQIRSFVYKYLDDNNLHFSLGERIYVTREKVGKRIFENEQAVQNLLVSLDFQVISFEDYSIFEQVSIMRSAKYFISIHGAGMANVSFMQEGGKVLELIKTVEGKKDARFSIWRLCSVLQLQYHIQFCEPKRDKNIAMAVNQDLKADLDLLKKNVELMLSD